MPLRRALLRAGVVIVAVAALAGCATPEYTATKAQRDLEQIGVTRDQAQCMLRGLRTYYSNQYVALQHAQGVGAINPKEVDLYVRNKFAGQDKVDSADLAEAHKVATACGVSR